MSGSRAAEMLEDLLNRHEARPPSGHRSTLFERSRPTDSGAGAGIRSRLTSLRYSRLAMASLVVVASVVALLCWDYVSRPEPAEERIPIAQDQPSGSSADGPSAHRDKAASGGSTKSIVSTDDSGTARDGSEKLFVHVAGAVVSPGVVQLQAGSRVVDAVAAAGGLRSDADPDRVNLAAQLVDGSRVVVPVVGQAVPSEVPVELPLPAESADSGGSAALVNINTATAEELEELPGVGPSTAAAILAQREEDGPFRSVESLLEVRGIGDAKLDAIRDLVTVGTG